MASEKTTKYSQMEMQSSTILSEQQPQNEDNLEEDFDGPFWIKVRETFEKDKRITWSKAMDKVRVSRLVEQYKDNGEKPDYDPLLLLVKKWPQKYKGKVELVDPQIERFARILLEDNQDMNKNNRYETYRDLSPENKDDPLDKQYTLGRTLLHYAAKNNLFHVASTLIELCPGLLALKTRAVLPPHFKQRELLAVEVAMDLKHDDVAALLFKHTSHERVQTMFTWRPDPALKSPKPAQQSFHEVLCNPKMKKTTIAILDCMVNPHWPYLPDKKNDYSSPEEEETIEGVWATVPEDPLDYHFFYHILDGDEGGRPPKIRDPETNELVPNRFFNKKAPSCLNIIANGDNIDAVHHPVVRMMIRAKWEAFGQEILCFRGGLYAVFLLFLSFALIHGSTSDNPYYYEHPGDKVRAVTEIFVIIFLCLYIVEEINQVVREKKMYLKDKYNVLDWLGMLLLLAIIPLRWINHDAQWHVASIGYLINFLRLFKFSSINKTLGLYTNTLFKIIVSDIPRFLCTFAVIFLSFCGALFLALRASRSQTLIGGFEQVLLSGVRVLAESQPVAEDYNGFNWLSILLLLTYMGTVVVILLNILIAQLSATYSQAKKNAKLQYDVDRMLLLARIENYPLLNLRVKYYKEGDWINELNLAKELLEFTEERHSLETIEQKLNLLRDMMRKIVKTIKPAKH